MEVEFTGDQEDDRLDRSEAGESTRTAFGVCVLLVQRTLLVKADVTAKAMDCKRAAIPG